MIKLIALDMDGTLLNHKGIITEKTLEVLQQAHEQKIKLAICSGRPYESAEKVLRPLHLSEKQGYFCGMNGQIIHSFKTGKTITFPVLSETEIKELLQVIDDVPVCAFLYTQKQCLITASKAFHWIAHLLNATRNLFWIFRQNDSYENTTFINKENVNLKEAGKICFCGLPGNLKKIQKIIETPDSKYSCVYVSSFWMECQHKEISKGNALKLIAEMENISLDEIIAYGDGENDISMLKTAKIGVAMNNAMPKVKAIADEICPSNKKDGIAIHLKKKIS